MNLFGRVIDLPAVDGSVVKQEVDTYIPTKKLTYIGPQMPTSAVAGLIGDEADNILVLNSLVMAFPFHIFLFLILTLFHFYYFVQISFADESCKRYSVN